MKSFFLLISKRMKNLAKKKLKQLKNINGSQPHNQISIVSETYLEGFLNPDSISNL